jgi:HlyD family secretion protein
MHNGAAHSAAARERRGHWGPASDRAGVWGGAPLNMKWRLFTVAVIVALAGLTARAIDAWRADDAPQVVTDAVTRGAIVSSISASGTVEAVTTVQVGSQISGSVQALYADFNSVVKKGQIVARLDPSLVQADIDQARAAVIRAEAEVERLQVALVDAQTKANRARELADRQLIPTTDLEAAEVTRQSSEAQVRSARAQVTQARAALSQTEVNLQKTVIRSPIDGIVIARDVDVGQTVAASLQAPTLFSIAADMSEMQVKASIDESDLGQIKEGQTATFSVDAYPLDAFTGKVRQVRLNPVVEQNVVTYAAIITAPNPELKLRPGLTANVTVATARRDDVLRVPVAALRFKPTAELLTALGPGKNAPTTNQPATPNVNTVWLVDEDGLHPVRVQVGATDGTFMEVASEHLQEGARIATRTAAAATTSRPAPASGNPLMAPPPRRF